MERCLVTHNRVDFERLHLQFLAEGQSHWGIIVTPQKRRDALVLLVEALAADEVMGQLLYA